MASRGLSSYVNRALGRQLQHDRLTRLLQELEDEAGPVDDTILEEVRRAWPAPERETGERRVDPGRRSGDRAGAG